MTQVTNTAKQDVAIAALVAGAQLRDAAKQAQVHVSTLRDWRTQPDFTARLEAAQRAALDALLPQLAARLCNTVPAMLAVLEQVALDTKAPKSCRVAAANSVLAAMWKAFDMTSIDERLSALEQAQGGRQ